MTSPFHSQFGEDQAIYPLFLDQPDGFYVDLGAYDGILESNTYLFEQLGWHGICVEPVASLYRQLCVNRPRSLCLNIAMWDSNQPSCNFTVLHQQGWSHMEATPPHPDQSSPIIAVEHPSTLTIDQLFRCLTVPPRFDLLSIDVEGSEPVVLRQFDLEKYQPRIVIIESWFQSKQFDTFFKEYTPVYAWDQGVKGTNIIYCREPSDATVVAEHWHV